ncbi:MAG: acyltransferase domain-containing protein, partial [Elusimicrobiota bacterium]
MSFLNEKIAIIGIGVIAPKAFNKDEFWKNIINKNNCITEVPKDRWDWRLYYDPDPKVKDKTYSKIGGFIENFKFDPIKYRIPPASALQISRLQQLTIEAVQMALDDAGYKSERWDPQRVGVVIANAMGAMRKEMTDLRVYKFFNEDLISKTEVFKSLNDEQKKRLIEEYEKYIDEYILNITEDTMPGELANVTSGRIANVFNFNGPNLILDAACASSIAALDYAVMALRTGKCDVVISGGADEMMSPAAYVKFCKIGALSPDGSFPFDARANGFVMGEAVGIYVLKRLSDAVRDGDRIYALINAIGASSDGKGKGITAPNPKGQKIAIENAFKDLDYTPSDVDYIECHGTATRVGDATECEVLKDIFKQHLDGRKLKVTSVKSNIGHTKAAAGSVSIIKAALSLYKKILPPSANFKDPNPNIDFSIIEVITELEDWKTDRVRRVNVSSFGFGGTNFHVAMEEYLEGKTKYAVNSSYEKIQIKENKEMNNINIENTDIKEDPKAPFSLLQGETYTITAKDLNSLSREIEELRNRVKTLGDVYPQTLISVELNSKAQEELGVSIVSKSPKDLLEKIDILKKNFNEKIFDEIPLNFKLKGIYPFKKRINYKGKVGFVFPGQGSQYVDMMKDLAMKYDVVMDTFKEANKILEKMIGVNLTDTLWSKAGETKEDLIKREEAIKQTQMTQPAVMTADMAMFRLLMSFGIKPEMVIGHSLGEYAAATAAGIFTLENGLRAVTSRAKEMSNIKVKDPGKMASVAWSYEKVEEQLKKVNGYVVAANKNCPIQTVIAGEKEAVDEAIKLFKSMGIEAQEIAVSHAFHSEIIRPAIEPYRAFLKKIPIKSWEIPIISNVTADFFPKDTEKIYNLLVDQMVSPVEFINQIKKMYDEGVRVFIECGPKRVLSAFVAETLKEKKDVFILSTNHPKRGGIYDFNDALANLMTVNFNLDWSDKHIDRNSKFYNPYYLNWALKTAGLEKQIEVKTQTFKEEEVMNISEFAKNYGFNFNPISISGIAAGAPGSYNELFRERALDEILEGKNMIDPIPIEWRKKQIEKNIIRVVKSETGNHRIEVIDSVDDAIKLSARKGKFDIVSEFGVPTKVAEALNDTFRMAIAAGILALKDAHIPLVHYYKRTTTGGWLPEKWALPPEIANETGVIFASAFPTMESIIKEVVGYFMDKYGSLSDDKLWNVYESLVDKIHSEEDKKEIRRWMRENVSKFSSSDKKEKYQFSQNFLLKVIPIADSQFAQFVGAKGPAIHLSAACSSTTQAVHVAESWIRSGKCKRVVVIGADDITNETLQEWCMPGFLASGTATTKEKVEDAALPFDRRRHGLIVGSGAVALVIEDETLVRERGIVPLARLLLTEAANSAYHVTRLDTDHVADVMNNFISKIEKIYGLNRSEIASKTLFVSHETYTPARGGSASAEVKALKKAFGPGASKVVVSNVKGFTGHTMGASLEDAVAVRALNTGIVPPIANYKEPDPELEGINLSKGGKYDLKYAIRFAAGFGSHMGMSFIEKIYTVGEKRIFDEKKYNDWLKKISGYDSVELEIVNNALRIKDKGPSDFKFTGKEYQETEKLLVEETKKEKNEQEVLPNINKENLTEEKVSETIVNMISEKTGYPKDMLDLDLDMEADLGIDTVKQAELFGMIREHYGIPRQEN